MASFWNGYTLKDFLFPGFDVKTPEGFAGLFVSIVSISICYEGIRTLRDYVFKRFLDSKKISLRISRLNNTPPPPQPQLVRYTKNGAGDERQSDESERELLPKIHNANMNGGGGDACPGPSSGINNCDDVINEDNDSKYKRPLVSATSPYHDTTTPIFSQNQANRRLMQWMDLSLSSLLHMFYVTVSYTLMLAVMTWNVMILVAVAIGIGIGYCIFGSLRHNVEFSIFRHFDKLDPCQERLLPSHDQSKTTETSSAGEGSSGSDTLCAGSVIAGRSDSGTLIFSGTSEKAGTDPRENDDAELVKELVIGVQVHNTSQLDELSCSPKENRT